MPGSLLVDVQRALCLMDSTAMRVSFREPLRRHGCGRAAPRAGTRRASGLHGLNAKRKLTMVISLFGPANSVLQPPTRHRILASR